MQHDYQHFAGELENLMGLSAAPLAITFSQEPPSDVRRYEAPMPPPTPDGRTGAVATGCVFWVEATHRTFTTVPVDHGNCSVGSLTHGLISLEEAATKADVAAICEAGWVSPDVFPQIQTVSEHPQYITYGPLGETTVDPDVVFLRINGKQAMLLFDAWPEFRFEGKPQCHIVAIAKEQGEVAVSVGCMLSRVRTGMSNHEMTCALPARALP